MSSCKGCLHRNRDQIDAQLIAGVGYRSISQAFGLSMGCINRHRKHVVAMIKELSHEERAERGGSLLARVEGLITQAEEIAALAKTDKSYAAATNALNTIARALELIGKLSGELTAPGAGIHFHSTRNVTTVININDDTEIAVLVQEATRNFSEVEILRLKALAASAPSQPQP